MYIYGTIKNVPNHQPEHQANSSSFTIPLPLWWGWTQSYSSGHPAFFSLQNAVPDSTKW